MIQLNSYVDDLKQTHYYTINKKILSTLCYSRDPLNIPNGEYCCGIHINNPDLTPQKIRNEINYAQTKMLEYCESYNNIIRIYLRSEILKLYEYNIVT